MMDRAIKANRPVPQNSSRSKPSKVTAAAHGNGCRSESKKKPGRNGRAFLFSGVPQLVG
jgi:hypothetical protein